MSDLITLLRANPTDQKWTGPGGLFHRAAEEIERLRAALGKALEAGKPGLTGVLPESKES